MSLSSRDSLNQGKNPAGSSESFATEGALLLALASRDIVSFCSGVMGVGTLPGVDDAMMCDRYSVVLR